MIYKRRYLQFNDLVFDGYDMIHEADGSVSFKSNSESYPYRHGSYVAFKKPYVFAESSSVSMTLKLYLKKLPCEMRQYYIDFAIEQLTKPGKLWAVKNNQLIWAYAYVTNYNEIQGYEKNLFEIDVDFEVYEGVWHKADKHMTFLTDYNICDYLLCHGYRTEKKCSQDGCTDIYEINDNRLCCCDCDELTVENSLCHMEDNLQDFYRGCFGGYHIVYDCEKGQSLFGDNYLGDKMCTDDVCDDTIAGQLYSNTDIPTDGVTVILTGVLKDPQITINDNTNIIRGDYEGTLTVYPSGDVYYTTDCCDTLLDPSLMEIPTGNTFGWEVHKGNNRFIVHSCCGLRCAYVQVDALTI